VGTALVTAASAALVAAVCAVFAVSASSSTSSDALSSLVVPLDSSPARLDDESGLIAAGSGSDAVSFSRPESLAGAIAAGGADGASGAGAEKFSIWLIGASGSESQSAG
jgi:hypothetical protein